jgi:hypothetical protein
MAHAGGMLPAVLGRRTTVWANRRGLPRRALVRGKCVRVRVSAWYILKESRARYEERLRALIAYSADAPTVYQPWSLEVCAKVRVRARVFSRHINRYIT